MLTKQMRHEQAVRIASELQNIIHSAGLSTYWHFLSRGLVVTPSTTVVAVQAAAPIIAVDRNNRITEPVCPAVTASLPHISPSSA